jgi:uncharacterized protein
LLLNVTSKYDNFGTCEAMSREYPDWISPGRAAEGKRIFSGTVPFSRMKRLAALLVDADGEASFTTKFSVDLEKRVVIDVHVQAALPLICQASLERYDEMVDRHSELAVVDEELKQEELPENYEPVHTEKGRLAIASLVEDELLLGLPQIPRKPGLEDVEFSTSGKFVRQEDPEPREKKNPFSALQDMLKQDK